MTIIDFLIIGSVGYSLYAFVSHQKHLSRSKASLSLIAVLLGLLLIALFSVADLVTMYIFPLFMPAGAAMTAMLDLHLNYYWIVALFGISAIAFGFAATSQKIFHVIRKLHDNEERFAVAASGTNEGLWDWNILTDECYFSPRWKQILGFEDHELENVKQTFIDALHEDDKDRVMAAVRSHLEKRVPYDIEIRLRHKDGHYVLVRSKGQAIWDEKGNPRRWTSSISDVSERQRAEREIASQSALLETTFENMSQGISVYDADLKLVAFNERYVDLMDYPPGFIHLGKPFQEILRFCAERGDYGPGDVEKLVKERTLSRRRGELYRRERTTADGRTLAISSSPMPDGGHVKTYTDITERKRAEEALRESEHALQERVATLEEAQRKLERQGEDLTRLAEDLQNARDWAETANRAKSEFLAAMSHELRTPLNAIIGFSEIMKNQTFGPVGSVEYREYAGDIYGSGQHLLELINDILDLSKIESGAQELFEDAIEVPKVTETVLRLVRQRAEEREVELELDLADSLPLLNGDERKVKQILTNLLTNAVKFTDSGGTVTLRAWCNADSGFVFQIADTGIGIAPDDIPKALSQFGQVDSNLNRKYAGTGLGLPLTKALVELHGGYLDVQSQIGVGTTVTVRFPAARIVQVPLVDTAGSPAA